ncbi:MAG TPA: sodium:solute symporter [Vicinamibacterales bacterium]|jgi:SSS family solute:Na+ symporter|nr:sodium:solute symporter [Vicinamibacterales bacterium]
MRTDITVVFLFFFVMVTVLGFIAARWRRGDLDRLDEWGLAGRRFGTVVTWFLLGGDLYTAYTFVAVPALVYGAGAIGFFAVPYTLLAFPIAFIVFPRLWSVSHRHGYITAADFVSGRFGSRSLALAVAVTGILATMPYIALQLVGIEVVIAGMGFSASTGLTADLPLIIAFVILAAYTYNSGLRAPALIALVKDVLIYVTVIAAVIVIPLHLGGYAAIFGRIPAGKLLLAPPQGNNFGASTAYATLAFGSALALFLYPHAITGLLSASSRDVIRRNMALLPAYSLALAMIAALGFMAAAAGVAAKPAYAPYFARYGPNFAVPALFLDQFPGWFVGVAFAAIAIGALVPAAIMSIAAANLFTRNIYRDLFHRSLGGAAEATAAKRVSLVIKVGALAFIILLPSQYAIELQLLGGVWIIQTLPAIIIGVFTPWFRGRALTLGWLTGMAAGTGMVASLHFQSSTYPLHLAGFIVPGYAALYSLILNLIVATATTLVMNGLNLPRAVDQTAPGDYR